MTSKRAALIAALIAALGLPACGGSSVTRIQDAAKSGRPEPVKLPPVKPEAMREFEAGMRALRLAGKQPSADALDTAKRRLRKAVELDGKLWEAWHNIGVIEFSEGSDDAAAEAFGKALDINPGHIESLVARAEALRRDGQTKRARTDYEQAIGLAPDESQLKRDATARLASLLREARQYDDAIAVIRETMRTAGANAKVYVELGLVYLAQGRDELTTLVLSKAADIDPKEPAIYNARALLALSKGHAQEAFDRFDYATSLDPAYLDARFNKASVLLDAGDFARAKAELDAVVSQDPNDLPAQVALGVAHRGLKQYDQAKTVWEQVIKRAPRGSTVRADALFNLAILQMNFLENEKGAAATLDRYLQTAPRAHPKRKEAQEKKKELGL